MEVVENGGYKKYMAEKAYKEDRAEKTAELTLKALKDQIKSNEKSIKLNRIGLIVSATLAVISLIVSYFD